MPYCSNCGFAVTGNFCPRCGYNVNQAHQQQFASHYPVPYSQQQFVPTPKRTIASLVFGVIVIIILIIAMNTAWFSITRENSGEVKIDYTLEQEIIESDFINDETDLNDISGQHLDDVGALTGLLMLIGIIMMVLMFVFVCCVIGLYYSRMYRYTRMLNNLALLLCLFSLIFVLIAPIYYMAAWTNEIGDYPAWGEIDSFWGSDSGGSYEVRWGPGIGWIFAIISIMLILFTLYMVKIGGIEVMRLASYTPPVPRPQYGMYQPSQYYQPYPPNIPLLYYPPPPNPMFSPPGPNQGYPFASKPPQFKPPAEPKQPEIQKEQSEDIPEPSQESQPTPQGAEITPSPTVSDEDSKTESKTTSQSKEKLSTEEKLKRLGDRFLKGEISEKTYLEIKGRYEHDLNKDKDSREEIPKSDDSV